MAAADSESGEARLDRRALITTTAGMVGGTVLLGACAARNSTPASDDPQATVRASSNLATVETTAGKIRGFVSNGIYTFRGVPYGASTAGEARFLPSSPPAPWSGVRPTLQLGCVCPQPKRTNWKFPEMAFLMDWEDGRPDEECLVLNVWAPGLGDGKKRPVMVWLHGGAYVVGSGHELPSYNGENLSRRGDVVVITVNHRLGVLGYLNLAGLGDERFECCANVALLDIVRALEWVRDNVTGFGGDPANITLFGQSAGGGEVSTLMAMPAARGLFQRAVVQSGGAIRHTKREHAEQLRDAVIAELGLDHSTFRKVRSVPVESLIEAGAKVWRRISPGFAPWVDGTVLPADPFDPVAPQISAQVPLLIGATTNEMSPCGDPSGEAAFADVEAYAKRTYGAHAPEVLAEARRLHPRAGSLELGTLIAPGQVGIVRGAELQAHRKASQNAALVFMYSFGWHTPVLDGRPLAFHQSEIPFVFDNTDRCATCTGGGPEPRALAAKVSEAWIRFARTGNPNHPGLPHWPAYTGANGATMTLDTTCRLEHHPDRSLHDLIVSVLTSRTRQ